MPAGARDPLTMLRSRCIKRAVGGVRARAWSPRGALARARRRVPERAAVPASCVRASAAGATAADRRIGLLRRFEGGGPIHEIRSLFQVVQPEPALMDATAANQYPNSEHSHV
jgi:hypothetical protein